MRKFLPAALLAAALLASPASAEDFPNAEEFPDAEEFHCVALTMPEADYAALGDVIANGAEEMPASFDAASDSCAAEFDWSVEQRDDARAFALYASGFDAAVNLLDADGVSFEQVDTLMRSLPKGVATRMTDAEQEFTDADAALLVAGMDDAGIEVTDAHIEALTIVVIAALGMDSVEDRFAP